MTAETAQFILYCLFFFFLGVAAVLAVAQRMYARFQQRLETQAKEIKEAAKREAEVERNRIIVDAKEQALQLRRDAEQELAVERNQQHKLISKLERREELLVTQEESLIKQQRGLEHSQTVLTKKTRDLDQQRELLQQRIDEQTKVLEKASGLSRTEATDQLLDSLRDELQSEVGATLLKHQKILEQRVEQQSREMLLTAIQRFASAHTAESTTSTVDVPTDDMKGRIIGREGRNIRAFEKKTGVDLIIDDTPGVVIVSAFDPVRREIARASLEKLITDGRIHPSKIEETVDATEKEIDSFIERKGIEAADEVNVSGLHQRVIKMLGRLHFRTSYSQNVLRHSVEVAFISGLLAEMIGLDGDLGRRAGLLHDIGKAADHELEGGHPKIGGDLLARSGECDVVVHAARGHHDEIVTEYPYTMLVATADACSASRPGARRESLERYVKRMEELEAIAKRFDGVHQAFAISAGRELRVLVNSENTDDQHAAVICREIAKAFEQELTYPGEIKVTVVRESHFIEVAK
ncbi:ribonuclease Y [Crateriforma conspicua]|uniref:Ribonuclease Y n=1 Tax=Crateriforma conspicua TaxID=2527996 RepID=A0A5C5Y0D7_9PLAN|nr:ribonuclease Y [Crateriforma conspicua]TWT69087.1 Ribonuclease Y [Crateriforma conspicua]